jgi:ribosomal protein S18 acetylase RimI-like enzyme
MGPDGVRYIDCDDKLRAGIGECCGRTAFDHVVLSEGFTIVAMAPDAVGFIAVRYLPLPPPLAQVKEAMIWTIEVDPKYRRRGIATSLVDLAADRAGRAGCHQIRAWSSEDKTEAIALWRALGFGLCPSTTHSGGKEVRGYFVARPLRPTGVP